MSQLPSIAAMQGKSEEARVRRQGEINARAMEAAKRIDQKAEILFEHTIEELAEFIDRAAGEGRTETSIHIVKKEESAEALKRIRKKLEAAKYKVTIADDTVDHGDSAAPCVEHIHTIHVSWDWKR